jgi:hypothetical protein
MFETYDDYLNQIEKFAIENDISEFRVAKEAFHTATGKFEDGEAWYELRMKMFMDWFLLDRKGRNGITPLETYLLMLGNDLSTDVFEQMVHLTTTLRAAFRIECIKGHTLLLDDIISGGEWEVEATSPIAGLERGDLIDARIAYFGGRPIMCPGTVLHPREAREHVLNIVARAKAEGMPARETVDHLDKMRLKLDKYSNVRIQHIYQYPGDTRL